MKKADRIIPNYVAPGEGEKQIRQYHCTHLHSKLLGIKADGVLAITNKRIIFHATGSSVSGTSIIQSEIPMEDVSGISVYKGTCFSLKYVILGFAVILIFSGLFSTILSLFSIVSSSFATAMWWLCGFGGAIGAISLSKSNKYQSIGGLIFASLASASFSVLTGSSIMNTLNGSFLSSYSSYGSNSNAALSGLTVLLMLASSVMGLVLLFLFAKRITMSLAIGSKGGANAPILISGMGGLGLANSAAPKALESEPTEETDQMISELGALILDIQALGDFGIAKWTNE